MLWSLAIKTAKAWCLNHHIAKMLQIKCILGRFQRKKLYSGEFPKRTRHVLGEQAICLTTRSGLLQDVAVFCTKALTHCTTRTLNRQTQPLDISAWVCVLKSWRVLSERLKQRCHGYPRPTSSQSRYRTQALTAKEKEFLMISLTWIQMVHNTSVLPQLKLHPEKAPPVSQQSSVCLLSLFSLTFGLFCSSQFLLLTILHITSHSCRSIL